jgi:hypothetical protein
MAEGDTVRRMLEARYRELGPITFHQAAVLFNFTVLVMLWFFRKPQFIPGRASSGNPSSFQVGPHLKGQCHEIFCSWFF